MHVIGWRAWFTGGRRYASPTHSWADLPDDGCLAVRLYFNEVQHGRRLSRVCSGNDHYFWMPGETPREDIYGHSNDTREDIERRYPGVVIRRGKWTHEAEMQAVNAELADANEAP